MSRQTRTTPSRGRRAVIAITWLAASGGAVAVLLIAAARAEGGTYRVVQCDPGTGIGQGDLDFERSTDHYRGTVACREGHGLSVAHYARRTLFGRWGAWGVRAPAEAELRAVSTVVSGSSAAGHVPELVVEPLSGEPVTFGRAAGAAHRARWSGEGAEAFRARLRCARRGGCGEGGEAEVRIRRLRLELADLVAPAVEIGGPLTSGRTQRGDQRIETIVTDRGSGVRRVFLEVNGEPLAERTLDCALAARVATRVQPCPASGEPGFNAATAYPPFRQGPNRVRVCALDFAPASQPNRECVARRARVDNACPVGDGGPAGILRAHLSGGRQRLVSNHGEPARVYGRLVDGAGDGVGGEQVCVATRTDLPGTAERVVATPVTRGDGSFAARLRPGPSREVRLAHWPDAERVSERFLRLDVRARPALRLRPRHTLRNGDRLRFAIRLHGPHAGRRHVQLEVWASGSWLPLRTGRTDLDGRWRASYRFHATSGERTYRFRAFVPRQLGYPYLAGRSPVRRAKVVG
jgi:hypothetical protein